MANQLAIAAVAKTVLKLLEDHCPRELFAADPLFHLTAGMDFTDDPVNEGYTVQVWRVAVNSSLRNQPPRRAADGRRMRPALPVDLSLLVTPWAAEPERQLCLLGWTLRFIEDHSIIPAALLNQSLTRQDRPPFGADEAVEIFCDTPAVPDYLGLWDKFRNRWQTSLAYTVRMVNLESELGSSEGPPVRSREFQVGQPSGGTP